jgi:hypothetical protein
MAKEWLNHYVDVEGCWQRGQREFFKSSNTVSLGGASVRIYETARSGDVVLSPIAPRRWWWCTWRASAGVRFSSYGSVEVYLKSFFQMGNAITCLLLLERPLSWPTLTVSSLISCSWSEMRQLKECFTER